MLRRIYQRGMPKMDFQSGGWWIIDDTGLEYAVGVTSAIVVWPPGIQPPLPSKPYSGVGRPPAVPRQTAALHPMSVKAIDRKSVV